MTSTLIHFEIVDAQTGDLRSWGSTDSLDVIAQDYTATDRTHDGRVTLVRVDTESWKTRTTLPDLNTRDRAAERRTRVDNAVAELMQALADVTTHDAAGMHPNDAYGFRTLAEELDGFRDVILTRTR